MLEIFDKVAACLASSITSISSGIKVLLYRLSEPFILTFVRNAQGVAEVTTKSRAFISSTAKAKTAKLSELVNVYWVL